MIKRLQILASLLLTISLIGCAVDNFSNVPEHERIPTKWDGRWELANDDWPKHIYMWFEIKYGVISGRLGNTGWFEGEYLPISGKVEEDTFTFNRVYHADFDHTFDMEVLQATEGFINGFLFTEDNSRIMWLVRRKQQE